jgi:formylmethanofuran dehydrogenase subunit C
MAITLRWLDRTSLPVEAEVLSPKYLAGIGPGDVARLVLPVGTGEAEVGELFALENDGRGGAEEVRVEGDLGCVRSLGRGMDRGRLVVVGVAGAYLGAGMSGGTIEVEGNVGEWAGAEMRGGLIRVRGHAGRHIGAALPGSRLGMNDGVILVEGSVGDEAGRRMRRGLIVVGGSAGLGFGRSLIAGTLLVFGPVGRHVGMGMKRGTVGLFHDEAADLLPSFVPAGRYEFPFLGVYFRQLAAWGFPVPTRVTGAALERYNGDLAEGGQGEILMLAGPGERTRKVSG